MVTFCLIGKSKTQYIVLFLFFPQYLVDKRAVRCYNIGSGTGDACFIHIYGGCYEGY